MHLSTSDRLRLPVVYATRLMRRIRNYATVAGLRAKGCAVDWTAIIHPSAVFERSGGVISVGPRTHVDRGVILRAMGGAIHIGADSSVNAYSFLSGGGGLDIKDHVMIASHVSIYASNHIFANTDLPMGAQGLKMEGITIERDVWIGTGARIMDGVCIMTGCIVAAGAVVTQSTIPGTINAGVPARAIAHRKTT